MSPLPPDQQALLEEYQRRQILKDLADTYKGSLYEFVKAAWHVLEPGSPLVDNWHIKAICAAVQCVLEGWYCRKRGLPVAVLIQNLLINVPPGTAKSRIVSVMAPAWMWIKDPTWRAIFFSGGATVASRDSMFRRDLIKSEWYRDTFKPTWEIRVDQDAKLQFNNTAGGSLIALTAGQRITGNRADSLFVDDPNDAVEVLSEDVRTSINEVWWDQGAFNRVNDSIISTRIGIMQRLHEDDWAGHVMKMLEGQEPVWHHLNLPQEYEGEEKCLCGRKVCRLPLGKLDPRTEMGELLFPAKFPPAVLAQEKARLKEHGYSQQHQQRPFPKGGGLLKRVWFNHYEEDPKKMKFDEVFQSWDLAFKKTRTSDYVCGQVWGIKGVRRYLLDQVWGRYDFNETVKKIREVSKNWPRATAKYIEDKANGPAVITSLKNEIEGIIPVTPEGGKEARASAVGPLIEAGNVFLPKVSLRPWVEGLLLECESFPNGAHDDRVDAMTQALIKTLNRKYDETEDTRTVEQKMWDELAEQDKAAKQTGGEFEQLPLGFDFLQEPN